MIDFFVFQMQVHKMICDYNRKSITVWGNVKAETTEKLFKMVSKDMI